ncbi:hypothetical protein RESH_05701 [Rhodopirellula europaea SH398]|uniref:Uncharacterized protein n=1 Tax=Rhodopirellula europaea SH398 TaxID=1263868 RepID=M5RWF9_9BACT|nr:hypothetical protein RESH_05701 [Rhodopirellula europaea SH398]
MKSVVAVRNRFASSIEQLQKTLLVCLTEPFQHPVFQLLKWLHGVFDQFLALCGDRHVYDPTVLGAAIALDQFLRAEMIDQRRDRGDDLNHLLADFSAGQRPFSERQTAENIESGERQTVFTKKTREAVVELVTDAKEIQQHFLVQASKWLGAVQFLLQIHEEISWTRIVSLLNRLLVK